MPLGLAYYIMLDLVLVLLAVLWEVPAQAVHACRKNYDAR